FQDDVVGLTFSEFGRKAKENGNLGTDHGEIAPMFVFGSPVNGGVSGVNVDLTEASEDNNWQIQTFQYDYRQTIGTLLQDYLGADDQAIDATFFNYTDNESFSDNKISELIKSEFSVAENCYTNTLTENDNIVKLFTISPNPSNNSIILSGYNYNGDISYKIFDLNSRLILEGKAIIDEPINISSFMNGIYLITLQFNNRAETHRIIKY
ncbi:MAG TPA: T9SS type A sorting domain-containing protein, partial [Flavobacteriaceae bacterium]|nr:T9SS type A sorting domain-containing protein [Flavobacteriaceae bacterium]